MLQQEIIVEPKIYLNKLCLTIVHLFVTPTTKKWNKLAIYVMKMKLEINQDLSTMFGIVKTWTNFGSTRYVMLIRQL